jgi:hypothetical protein
MKRLNGYRKRLMLFGIVVVFVLGRGSAKADFTFGEPENLGLPLNSSSGDTVACFSADGLEMYLSSHRSDGYGGEDIWVVTKKTSERLPEGYWSEPQNLGVTVNSQSDDGSPCISSDGLEMYFHSNRGGGFYGLDIWMTRRSTIDDAWEIPENLGLSVNSSDWDGWPWLSSDGLELYFISRNRAGGCGDTDIWISRRATKNDPWKEPMNLGQPVNSSDSECWVSMSSDDLTLFFSGEFNLPIRPGGYGNSDMWMSRRSSISDPWGTPVNLGPIVNSSDFDCGPRVSSHGYTMYFSSERPGGFGGRRGDIYQASIIPIVDLNTDGIVDSADMVIMVDHWGTDNSSCDIGPMPWGDGIVDVQDLIVLAEHLFEEVPPVQ